MLFFQVLETIEDEDERRQLQKLFEKHSRYIACYIKNHFLLSPHDIEDAVGDVFQKVICERKEILHASPDIQIRQMLLIARRICLNKRKRNTLETKLFTSLEEITDNDEIHIEKQIDNNDFTEDIAEQEIDAQNISFIMKYISALDEITATIFIMKFAEHKSNVKIARLLHMNASTVGTILNRTMKKIRKEIEVKNHGKIQKF